MKKLLKSMLPASAYHHLRDLSARCHFIREHGFRYFGMSVFKNIPGFMMDTEAIKLYELAKSVSAPSATILEIGSWLGKSSVVLGAGLLAGGKGGRLVCVDPFDASGDSRSQARYEKEALKLEMSLMDAFRSNLDRVGVSAIATPLKGFSHDVAKSWKGDIALLFIDGNHSYESVKRDYIDWSVFVEPGGLIAFHDTWFSRPSKETIEYHEGPGQVINELVKYSTDLRFVCHVHSLYVVQKIAQSVAQPVAVL